MKQLLLLLGVSILLSSVALSQVQLAWMKTNVGTSAGYNDQARAVALDKAGNVYTTGWVYNAGQLQDILTIKRTATGDSLWGQTYTTAGGGYDQPRDLAVDDSACAIICGDVGGQFAVIKYGPDGVFRWIKKINGASVAEKVCVDNARNIYATGVAPGSGDDIIAVKIGPSGDSVWAYKYSGPTVEGDRPYGIAVDQSQNCYVSGESAGGLTNTDYVTIKINTNGTIGWVQRYNGASNGQDYGRTVALDASANVYVVGESGVNNKGLEACIVSYTSAGALRYAKYFNGISNYDDGFYALTIDANQNILVAGKRGLASGTAFFTAKMLPNATGDTVWTRQYVIPGTSYSTPFAIVTDSLGKSYVSGQCWGTTGDVGVVCFSVSGSVLWSARHDGPGSDDEVGYSLATSGNGVVYVAGSSIGSFSPTSYFDYVLFAFQETGTDVRAGEASPAEFVLAQNYPNPFNPSTVIKYQVPPEHGRSAMSSVRLAVYDLLGREAALLVNEMKSPGEYAATFSAAGMPSGVYFYRLQAGTFVQTRRMTLLR